MLQPITKPRVLGLTNHKAPRSSIEHTEAHDWSINPCLSGKPTTIRRIAVRETSVSLHHERPLPKPPVHRSTIVLRGLRWSPIMPRD